MSQTVDISPDTAALIESYARHSGLSVEEYLRTLLPSEGDLGLRNGDVTSDFQSDMESLAEESAEKNGSGIKAHPLRMIADMAMDVGVTDFAERHDFYANGKRED